MDAADWKAPPADRGIFLSPGTAELAAEARANHASLSRCDIRIHGRPLRDWRQRMRQILGYHDPERLLICSAHQAELYHPGVWIKLALISVLAEKIAGHALHVAVDSDEPKHLQLRWPGGAIGISEQIDGSAGWAARLAAPSIEHLDWVFTELEKVSRTWDFEPLALEFVHLLVAENQPNLPAAIAHAMQNLDRQIGLSYDLMMSGTIWSAEPYLAFVSHLIDRAEEFADCYNRALAEYRAENRIKSPGRPMPDLKRAENEIEMPFWLDDLSTGRRRRFTVARRRNEIPNLAEFCASRNVRLAPRALTLTMFLRLMVCDQWIHGIGGARYDQVTDRIIRKFFGIDPPAFGVATATLYFPSAEQRPRTEVSAVKHVGHQLQHRALGPAKQGYLEKISAAPRRSAERAELFAQMHRAIDQARPAAMAQWDQQWHQALQAAEEDRVLFDRELFYAMQPRSRLLELANRLG